MAYEFDDRRYYPSKASGKWTNEQAMPGDFRTARMRQYLEEMQGADENRGSMSTELSDIKRILAQIPITAADMPLDTSQGTLRAPTTGERLSGLLSMIPGYDIYNKSRTGAYSYGQKESPILDVLQAAGNFITPEKAGLGILPFVMAGIGKGAKGSIKGAAKKGWAENLGPNDLLRKTLDDLEAGKWGAGPPPQGEVTGSILDKLATLPEDMWSSLGQTIKARGRDTTQEQMTKAGRQQDQPFWRTDPEKWRYSPASDPLDFVSKLVQGSYDDPLTKMGPRVRAKAMEFARNLDPKGTPEELRNLATTLGNVSPQYTSQVVNDIKNPNFWDLGMRSQADKTAGDYIKDIMVGPASVIETGAKNLYNTVADILPTLGKDNPAITGIGTAVADAMTRLKKTGADTGIIAEKGPGWWNTVQNPSQARYIATDKDSWQRKTLKNIHETAGLNSDAPIVDNITELWKIAKVLGPLGLGGYGASQLMPEGNYTSVPYDKASWMEKYPLRMIPGGSTLETKYSGGTSTTPMTREDNLQVPAWWRPVQYSEKTEGPNYAPMDINDPENVLRQRRLYQQQAPSEGWRAANLWPGNW